MTANACASSIVGAAVAAETRDAVAEDFRLAMRRLASGVALVTSCDAEGRPCGIAMTAFMSLTMDPPALLIAVNRTASLCSPLLVHGRFAVNMLSEGQADLCKGFVTTPAAGRFDKLGWSEGPDGIPVVHGAVASIVCAVDKVEAFGSHVVIRGLVEKVMLGDCERPLAYLDGRYGTVRLNA